MIHTIRAALVTGGASGIGAAVTHRLRDQGADVLVADLRDPDDGTPFVSCDVRDPEASVRAVAEAERLFGRLDFVRLSAGIANTMDVTPETVDLDEYRRVVAVNVDGVVFGVRAATPALRRAGGGAMVALSSLAGLTPAPLDPLYTLTKHAVAGLVRALGPQLAGEGITINAICPGFVDTPMVDPLRASFSEHDFPLIPVATVVDTILRAATDGGSGECYLIQPGHNPAPYRFRGVPGARADATSAPIPVPEGAARP